MISATPERLGEFYGRFVSTVYTVSLLRSREHQVYVQDAEEMVSDAFTQGICSLNKRNQGLEQPFYNLWRQIVA